MKKEEMQGWFYVHFLCRVGVMATDGADHGVPGTVLPQQHRGSIGRHTKKLFQNRQCQQGQNSNFNFNHDF